MNWRAISFVTAIALTVLSVFLLSRRYYTALGVALGVVLLLVDKVLAGSDTTPALKEERI